MNPRPGEIPEQKSRGQFQFLETCSFLYWLLASTFLRRKFMVLVSGFLCSPCGGTNEHCSYWLAGRRNRGLTQTKSCHQPL